MDRVPNPIHVPTCPRQIPLVNQYMWPHKDSTQYHCNNGISHPIYDCQGHVQRALPLEEYEFNGQIHPQVRLTRRMHLNFRENPNFKVALEDLKSKRTEGFYVNGW